MKTLTVIHCWSAPRSRSTAVLYSFEARGSDCVALDEPLYREWLATCKNSVTRPYLENILSGTPPEGTPTEDIVKWENEKLTFLEKLTKASSQLSDNGVIFSKQMAKFADLYDFDNELELEGLTLIHKHMLLIRDPVAILSSWSTNGDVHGNNPTSAEVGIIPMLSIYSILQSRGMAVTVLDSDDLVKKPTEVLSALCSDLGLSYSDSMMTWKTGSHDCDGPWAKWWYADVHKSAGWAAAKGSQSKPRYRTLNPAYMPSLKASYPAFDFLKSLTRGYKARGPPANLKYEDPRNENVLVFIGAPGRGKIIPRDLAGVSPFDSSVQGGDAAWEGLRVYRGKILSLEKHLRRLFKSAKALGFKDVHTKEEVIQSIFRVLAANGMRDGAHMRLTLTRGEKCTSSMNPNFNVYGTTLIILPEWKPAEGATTYDNSAGISLITASQRRNPPQTLDSKIHHNNLINNILPKIQANLAGCADAIMLDIEGYVSETNATNIFMVDEGVLLTPHADHCLPGITRTTVLKLATELGIPNEVRRISLAEFHSADEVFTTGTMGEISPVVTIDGRSIGSGTRGPVTEKLQEVYKTLPEREGWATPLPPFDGIE